MVLMQEMEVKFNKVLWPKGTSFCFHNNYPINNLKVQIKQESRKREIIYHKFRNLLINFSLKIRIFKLILSEHFKSGFFIGNITQAIKSANKN